MNACLLPFQTSGLQTELASLAQLHFHSLEHEPTTPAPFKLTCRDRTCNDEVRIAPVSQDERDSLQRGPQAVHKVAQRKHSKRLASSSTSGPFCGSNRPENSSTSATAHAMLGLYPFNMSNCQGSQQDLHKGVIDTCRRGTSLM